MPRPYTDLSNLPELGCRAGTRFVSLQGVVSIIVTGRTIVPLEVFTNRARRASPLHRCAPYKVGTACRWRSMGAVSFACVIMIANLRHLWFGIPPVSNIRSQPSGSMVVHLEVFTNRARHASPLHRSIEPAGAGMPRWHPFCSSAGRHRYHRDATIVPLEVFTTWATHASPLHRSIEFTGLRCRSTPVLFLCRASSVSS